MTERDACTLLKSQFEAAGYKIAENQPFDEDGVTFEIDGFDATARVGYEYVTEEAGDSWDVDGRVIETLAERHKAGELHVLVIEETAAPDAKAIERAAQAFLAAIAKPEKPKAAKPKATKPAKATAAPKEKKKKAAAKPAAKDKKPARSKRATSAR
jgi:hypothetical protein